MLERTLYIVNLDPSRKYGSLEEQIFLIGEAVSQEGGTFIPVFAGELPAGESLRYKSAGLITASLNLLQFNLQTLRELLHLIDHYRIEVLHWNFYHPMNRYAMLLRLLRPRLRYYLTDHSSRPVSAGKSYGSLVTISKKLILRNYSKVLAISDYVLNVLQTQAIWDNLGRFHYFINVERFQPNSIIRSSMRSSRKATDAFIVLVVAYLIPEKGVDIVIRALKELPERVVLWVVGDGPESASLHSLAESTGLKERVWLCGLQTDVSPFMQAADCLVIPSLWNEAVGLVMLEAMACALPVIGSAVGGIPEFVIPNQTGNLFPAGDHAALGKRIHQLFSSPGQLKAMSAGARDFAVSQCSHKTRISDAVAIYRKS